MTIMSINNKNILLIEAIRREILVCTYTISEIGHKDT